MRTVDKAARLLRSASCAPSVSVQHLTLIKRLIEAPSRATGQSGRQESHGQGDHAVKSAVGAR